MEQTAPALQVTYDSPNSAAFTHQQTLPPLPAGSASAGEPSGGEGGALKTTADYLSRLRTAVVEAQTRINDELTSRMDEDKKRDAEAVAQGKRNKIDEEAEEENYGEEVVEEE